jgi:S1-C subfamily serine protease
MNLPEAIEMVRASVVQLSISVPSNGQDEFGSVTRVLGTGFIVSEVAHVLTAKHVVDSARQMVEQLGGGDLHVGVAHEKVDSSPGASMRGNFSLVAFTVVGEDAANDLALLQLHLNPIRGEVSSGIVIDDRPAAIVRQ